MRINENMIWQQYESSTLKMDLNKIAKMAIKSKKNTIETKKMTFNTKDRSRDQRLKKLANQFTSILTKQMFKAMRKTVPENKLIDGGFAEDVFTDMFDNELSRLGSTQQGFNTLSRLLYEELKAKSEG